MFCAMSNNEFIGKVIFPPQLETAAFPVTVVHLLSISFSIQEHHNSDQANLYPKGKQKPLEIPAWFPITKQRSLQL